MDGRRARHPQRSRLSHLEVPRAQGTGNRARSANCVTAARQARSMSRRRDLESSEWFHIVHKGADGQDIFSAPSHRAVYEEFVADAFERSAIELHAYAWLTNHLHKLVRVPRGGLPDAEVDCYGCVKVMNRVGCYSLHVVSREDHTDAQLGRLPVHPSQSAPDRRNRRSGRVPVVESRCVVRTSVRAPVAEHRFRDGRLRHRPLRAVRPGASTERSDGARRAAAPTPTECDDIERAVAAVTGRPIGELRVPKGKQTDVPRAVAIMLAVELRAGSSAELAAPVRPERSAFCSSNRAAWPGARCRVRSVRHVRAEIGVCGVPR